MMNPGEAKVLTALYFVGSVAHALLSASTIFAGPPPPGPESSKLSQAHDEDNGAGSEGLELDPPPTPPTPSPLGFWALSLPSDPSSSSQQAPRSFSAVFSCSLASSKWAL